MRRDRHDMHLEGKGERQRTDLGSRGRGPKGMMKSICARQGCRSGVCFRTSQVSMGSGGLVGQEPDDFQDDYILIGVVVT